ncbi:MAG: hypothetical protein WCJ40_02335 [Planctomycetota bacterium]
MSQAFVCCTHPECLEPAGYKIAAMWSDGRFRELKTYGHACVDHLGNIFQKAHLRCEATPRMPGEVIDEVGLYRFRPGSRDAFLERLWSLEESCRANSGQ